MRLPNLPTAAADAMMGYLVSGGPLPPAWPAWAVLGGSCLLYSAGMVLNDVFDYRTDALERPERPIPSGLVPLRAACRLGLLLLVSGAAMGWVASAGSSTARPAVVATLLALLVLLYDGLLKKTPAGPLAMGGCRLLNVLWGMSLVARTYRAEQWIVAAGIGIYITGVTLFARSEARASHRARLAAATALLLAGVALLATLPLWRPVSMMRPALWGILWMALALLVGWRCLWSLVRPEPHWVQAAVRHAIHSLIVLDAALVVATRGPGPALLVLALLIPTKWLSQYYAST